MALRAGDLVVVGPSDSLALQTLDAEAVTTGQHFDEGGRVRSVDGVDRVGVDAAGPADQTLAQAGAEKDGGGGRDRRRRRRFEEQILKRERC